jgi:BirA family biotin operon repressor/biotin-[acetyl-CoA-carboxylase] ligase
MMKIKRQHFSSIDSTSKWAKINLNCFDPEALTIISADEQTDGYGRQNRVWVSVPNKSLQLTFVFSVSKLSSDLCNLTQVTTMSVVRVLESFGLSANIHWPNDITINGKKIAGAMCEVTSFEDQQFIILGLGVNINSNTEELSGIDKSCTSIFLEKGETVNIEEVQESIETQFLIDLTLFLEKGFPAFFSVFSEMLCQKKDKKVIVNDFNEVSEGVFHSVNSNGSINVRMPLDEIRTFWAAEIL